MAPRASMAARPSTGGKHTGGKGIKTKAPRRNTGTGTGDIYRPQEMKKEQKDTPKLMRQPRRPRQTIPPLQTWHRRSSRDPQISTLNRPLDLKATLRSTGASLPPFIPTIESLAPLTSGTG